MTIMTTKNMKMTIMTKKSIKMTKTKIKTKIVTEVIQTQDQLTPHAKDNMKSSTSKSANVFLPDNAIMYATSH